MLIFLLRRPIATCMTFLALVILGLVSYHKLPISLLPNIEIPEITIKTSYDKYTAQEMESRFSAMLRRMLQQCAGLDKITSESSNGQSSIRMVFDHGIDIDLAGIEVNEKIDRITNWLPNDMERPAVVKSSATDIPVFFLNVSYKNEANQKTDFLALSRFTEQVVKKRLERLSEVGFVDPTGMDHPQIRIIPDMEKLDSYGFNIQHLENVIKSNNFNIGNIMVSDGYYRYDIRISSPIESIRGIKKLSLKAGNKIIRLGDVARIEVVSKKKSGFFMDNGQYAISMAIIKQVDAKMEDLKNTLASEIALITNDYPHLHFDIAQDQTELLQYSISNLKLTLTYGAFLGFIVLFLFIPNFRLPLLMGMTILISIVISVLFLMLCKISINIISLSGLVLGVGLMIDNAIIVIDNIRQFEERGGSLMYACAKATNEVLRPLLSSTLTTSAVFIPLIFMSGISGALFYDQAVTVTISLLMSFFVSIFLLPVLYMLVHKRRAPEVIKKRSFVNLEKPYEVGFKLVFGNKILSTTIFLLLIPLSVWLFQQVQKQNFPTFSQEAVIVDIKWNENISTQESHKRIKFLFHKIDKQVVQFNAWVGGQDYILNTAYNLKSDETRVYLKSKIDLNRLKNNILNYVRLNHLGAEINFSNPDNLFSKSFVQNQVPIILQLKASTIEIENDSILQVISLLDEKLNKKHLNALGQYDFVNLRYDREKLILYHVAEVELLRVLKTAFNKNEIGYLNTSNEVLPIIIGMDNKSLGEIINNLQVRNTNGRLLPITHFLELKKELDFEIVYAGKEGVYFPIHYDATSKEQSEIESNVGSFVTASDLPLSFSWSGSLYDFDNNISDLFGALLISLLLLYFILAIQFESLLQPLIILLEIPIDLAGSIFLLMLFGSSLNIMSAIGIVVMTGIIINDSILKLDSINRFYREQNLPLLEAIHQGGIRRIRPIIMTSITTILALLPFLFSNGLGAELQRPLALAIIGGLGIGTIISLYFIPLCYWWIYNIRASKNKNELNEKN